MDQEEFLRIRNHLLDLMLMRNPEVAELLKSFNHMMQYSWDGTGKVSFWEEIYEYLVIGDSRVAVAVNIHAYSTIRKKKSYLFHKRLNTFWVIENSIDIEKDDNPRRFEKVC